MRTKYQELLKFFDEDRHSDKNAFTCLRPYFEGGTLWILHSDDWRNGVKRVIQNHSLVERKKEKQPSKYSFVLESRGIPIVLCSWIKSTQEKTANHPNQKHTELDFKARSFVSEIGVMCSFSCVIACLTFSLGMFNDPVLAGKSLAWQLSSFLNFSGCFNIMLTNHSMPNIRSNFPRNKNILSRRRTITEMRFP